MVNMNPELRTRLLTRTLAAMLYPHVDCDTCCYMYVVSTSPTLSVKEVQSEVTYPNMLGPEGIRITEMFG